MCSVIVHDGFFKVKVVSTEHGNREFVVTSDSVCMLIFVSDIKKILLVRQNREAMIRDDNPKGEITELTGGRFDVQLSVKALAVKEAYEEVGAKIEQGDVTLLNDGLPMAVSAGVLTERSYLAFIEITSDQIEDQERIFGVDPGENITRVWLSVEEFAKYPCECVRVFALKNWFFGYLNFLA
jgi:8-oxo-dGTP pyrophosphatase MutT (NUDIX family)